MGKDADLPGSGPGQPVHSGPLVLWTYFWLLHLGWRCSWRASYHTQAAPRTKNDLTLNFHCAEVETSWSAMSIRK